MASKLRLLSYIDFCRVLTAVSEAVFLFDSYYNVAYSATSYMHNAIKLAVVRLR